MRPYGGDIEFFSHLLKSLRQVELGNIAAGVAPEHVASALYGDLHPALEQCCPQMPAAVFLICRHTPKLELELARDIRVACFIEGPDRDDALAVERSQMIGRLVIIARKHAIFDRPSSAKDTMPKWICLLGRDFFDGQVQLELGLTLLFGETMNYARQN